MYCCRWTGLLLVWCGRAANRTDSNCPSASTTMIFSHRFGPDLNFSTESEIIGVVEPAVGPFCTLIRNCVTKINTLLSCREGCVLTFWAGVPSCHFTLVRCSSDKSLWVSEVIFLLSFFKPNVSFKMLSKALLRRSCSLWLFSNISVCLIVGVDRLDKDLTIGQMQGKYLILLLYPYCNALFWMLARCYGYTNERELEWPLTGAVYIKTNVRYRISPFQSVL